MILTSLQNNSHIAVLLGLSQQMEEKQLGTSFCPDLHLADVLMKNILRNLAFETVNIFLLKQAVLGGEKAHAIYTYTCTTKRWKCWVSSLDKTGQRQNARLLQVNQKMTLFWTLAWHYVLLRASCCRELSFSAISNLTLRVLMSTEVLKMYWIGIKC